MEKLHSKQKLILVKFYEQNPQKYSELYKYFNYEDRFPYHIKQLVNKGYLTKRDGVYWITSEGMKIMGSFDAIDEDPEFKYTALYLRIYSSNQFFLNERLLENQQKHYYFLHGKIYFNESIRDAITRLTHNKINLSQCDYKHLCTVNYTFKNTKEKILFSNIGIVLDIQILDPNNIEMSENSGCIWIDKEKLHTLSSIDALSQKLIIDDVQSPLFELEWKFNYGLNDQDL